MSYVRIDNLRLHEESPFFSRFTLSDNGAKEVLVSSKSFKEDEFFRELTIRLSKKHRLNKTSKRLLYVFLKEFSKALDMREGATFATREIAGKAGYKNVSSVYRGIGDLCNAGLVALKKGGSDGTFTIFPNPSVFGKREYLIGEKLLMED